MATPNTYEELGHKGKKRATNVMGSTVVARMPMGDALNNRTPGDEETRGERLRKWSKMFGGKISVPFRRSR